MSEELDLKKPLPLWRRIALSLIVLAMVGLVVSMLAGYIIEKCLDSRIAAISKADFPVSFEQLAPAIDEASTEEASVIYASVLKQLVTEDMEVLTKIFAAYRIAIGADALDKLPQELHRDIASTLKQHQSSLTALDNAAILPLSQFDIEMRYGKDACVKSLNKIQKALTILSLRTTFLLVAKQYDPSAKSIVSTLKAIRVFDTYPTLLVSRTKHHFLKLVCDDIRLLLSHGHPSGSMLDELSIALADAIQTDNIKDSLLAEQVYQIETSRNLFSKKLIINFLQKNAPDMPERANLPETLRGKIRLRLFVLRYFNAMGKLIETSSKPTHELLEYVNGQKETVSGKFKQVFAPTHRFVETSMETTAIARGTILALHVERYRRANGSVPDSLQVILPDVDPIAATDPCSGRKMLYKKDELSYTIYSIGFDRIDNDGSTRAKISHDTDKIKKEPEDIGLRIILPKKS